MDRLHAATGHSHGTGHYSPDAATGPPPGMAFLEELFTQCPVTAYFRKSVTILPPIFGIDIQLQMRRFYGNRRDTFYAATVLHHRSQHTNVSLQECHICNVRMSCHYRCYGVAYGMFDHGVSIAQKMPPYEIIVTTPPKWHS